MYVFCTQQGLSCLLPSLRTGGGLWMHNFEPAGGAAAQEAGERAGKGCAWRVDQLGSCRWGVGGIQREGSSPGHTSASHAHTGRHTQHLAYVHNQGSTLHGKEAFPYKISLNPHNCLMGSAKVIPFYR